MENQSVNAFGYNAIGYCTESELNNIPKTLADTCWATPLNAPMYIAEKLTHYLLKESK